jgi:predicted permease
VRAYAAELALVAALACVGAVVLAAAAFRLLRHTAVANVPRLAGLSLDARSIAFAAAIAICAVIGCCLVPLLRIRRGLGLDRAARSATATRGEQRLRRTLIGAQVALALVVLTAAGVLFRSFQHLRAVRPGIDPTGVATFWVSLPPSRYHTDSAIVRFYADLEDRLRTLNGVTAVGFTSRLPLMTRGNNENPLYPEGSETANTKLPPLQLFSTIQGDYFGAFRIPLLAGHGFAPTRVQRDGEAVVSRRTAQFFWHDSTGVTVIGKRFRILPTSNWYTVVGVVADVHDSSLAHRPAPSVYFPQTPSSDPAESPVVRTMAAVIRTTRDPSTVGAAARQIVHDLDPTLPIFDSQPMTDIVRASSANLGFTSVILGVAACIALLLGAIGLYGVMSYVVSLRRRELGIRLALGASPRSLAMATAREAMTVTAVGMAVGFVLFAAAARFVSALLFDVAPWDPLTVASTSLGLCLTALIASWLPARRASLVDAAETLRGE